jgi:hypothetical protein
MRYPRSLALPAVYISSSRNVRISLAITTHVQVIRQLEGPPQEVEPNARTAFDDQIDAVTAQIDKINRTFRSGFLGRDRYMNQCVTLLVWRGCV